MRLLGMLGSFVGFGSFARGCYFLNTLQSWLRCLILAVELVYYFDGSFKFGVRNEICAGVLVLEYNMRAAWLVLSCLQKGTLKGE